ncbi:hypothetical protein CDAR_404421 [Caerostris darwini]|uniref:Uncharacterized protein n=1 Tax=Caerostris darwini TaxID=1538125 RepID=A0AAV4SRD3_9ARAC|nr:hypothetical protein CDAR_404421 [Caerostris darwini]
MFVLMPEPLPNLSTFFFDIHPCQHNRQNSSSSKSRGAPKCFRFFRIQNTEVMLIDDRNIAEIYAMRFFSEVAAAIAPLGRRRPWHQQLEGVWVGNKGKKKRRKRRRRRKIFHLSLERLRLPTHIDSLEEDPVFIPSIRMRFLGNGEVFRGIHFMKLLEIQNCPDTGSGVVCRVSKSREIKKIN